MAPSAAVSRVRVPQCRGLVLDNLPGCQYRITSYNTADVTDVDPAFGLQLHRQRFLEYVGAPKLACLLSCPPGHWLHHVDREEAVPTALQLQHEAGFMMTNCWQVEPICDITELDVV